MDRAQRLLQPTRGLLVASQQKVLEEKRHRASVARLSAAPEIKGTAPGREGASSGHCPGRMLPAALQPGS